MARHVLHSSHRPKCISVTELYEFNYTSQRPINLTLSTSLASVLCQGFAQELTSRGFFRNPLADVGWAIRELDPAGYAALEKADSVTIHQGHIFQIHDDSATSRLGFQKIHQRGYLFCVYSAAHLEDHVTVR